MDAAGAGAAVFETAEGGGRGRGWLPAMADAVGADGGGGAADAVAGRGGDKLVAGGGVDVVIGGCVRVG